MTSPDKNSPAPSKSTKPTYAEVASRSRTPSPRISAQTTSTTATRPATPYPSNRPNTRSTSTTANAPRGQQASTRILLPQPPTTQPSTVPRPTTNTTEPNATPRTLNNANTASASRPPTKQSKQNRTTKTKEEGKKKTKSGGDKAAEEDEAEKQARIKRLTDIAVAAQEDARREADSNPTTATQDAEGTTPEDQRAPQPTQPGTGRSKGAKTHKLQPVVSIYHPSCVESGR